MTKQCQVDVVTYHTMDGPGAGTSKQTETQQIACDNNSQRGIPLTTVCNLCKDSKLSKYRDDVLNDPHYQSDEDLWEEEGVY